MRRVVIAAMTSVAVCDVVSAVAVPVIGFHFGWRGPILLAIYAIAGYFARRVGGLRAPMLVGLASATVDAVIAVAWAIGPGRFSDQYAVANTAVTVIIILALGALFGTIGGVLAPPSRRRVTAS